jgi:hypothetical protein
LVAARIFRLYLLCVWSTFHTHLKHIHLMRHRAPPLKSGARTICWATCASDAIRWSSPTTRPFRPGHRVSCGAARGRLQVIWSTSKGNKIICLVLSICGKPRHHRLFDPRGCEVWSIIKYRGLFVPSWFDSCPCRGQWGFKTR